MEQVGFCTGAGRDCPVKAPTKISSLLDLGLLQAAQWETVELSRHREFTVGDVWYLEDGHSYTSLWAEGGHANGDVGSTSYSSAEQWATRRWISDTAGTLTISGHAGKVMPWGANWRGECQATIIVDGEVVFSTVMDEHGLDYLVAVKVQEKSIVDFLIAPNPSIGVVKFTATIRKRPT